MVPVAPVSRASCSTATVPAFAGPSWRARRRGRHPAAGYRAAADDRYLQPHQRHHRDQRVLDDVAQDHQALAQAWWPARSSAKESGCGERGRALLLLHQPGRGSHRTGERRCERTVKRLDLVGHLDFAEFRASQCRQPGTGNTPPFDQPAQLAVKIARHERQSTSSDHVRQQSTQPPSPAFVPATPVPPVRGSPWCGPTG